MTVQFAGVSQKTWAHHKPWNLLRHVEERRESETLRVMALGLQAAAFGLRAPAMVFLATMELRATVWCSKWLRWHFRRRLSGSFKIWHHTVRQCNVNAWTPCGAPVLGAGGEPKEKYIYKWIFTNRCTSGHAEAVEGVRKCQPCFFIPCAVQPMSQLAGLRQKAVTF